MWSYLSIATVDSVLNFLPPSLRCKVEIYNFGGSEQCDQIGRNFATWANFQNLRQIFEGLFGAWKNFEPTLANSVYIFGKFEALNETK